MHGLPHLLIGAGLGLAVGQGDAGIAALTAAAALAPDLDTEHSMAARTLRLGLGVVAVGSIAAVAASATGLGGMTPSTDPTPTAVVLALAAVVVAGLVGTWLAPWRLTVHRGPLHSLLAVVAAGTLAELVTGQHVYGVAVAVGWLSHLVADAGTFYGLPLLWPLSLGAHEHPLMGGEKTCRMVHLTPTWLRWRSGNGFVELPLAIVVFVAGLAMKGA